MNSSSSSSSSPEITPAMVADTDPDRSSFKYDSREDVMDDLTSRFILNLPDEELASLERVCFQVEQAHWYYEDFVRENNPQFPSLPLKRFSEDLFNCCPLLHQWRGDHEEAFNKFMRYKTRVPVCGAIMLNSKWDKCVLVKGWKSSSGWGFPKGKINESESKPNCAIREVLEETGYNLAGQINLAHVIDVFIREQSISLYIVADVPEDYLFQTKTRKEISRIEWFKLTDLPTWKRNKTCQGKFYLISPFIAKLKEFINVNKPRMSPRKGARVKKAHSQADTSQESSSQSSDPHTPSPRSTELIANVANPNDDECTVTPVHDPHMAFLLSKLSGSNPLLSMTKADSRSSTQDSIPALVDDERRTPIPISASSTISDNHQRTSTVNPMKRSIKAPTTSTLICARPIAHISQTSSASVSEMPTGPSTHSHQEGARSSKSSSSSITPPLQRSYTTKSTADISPYLSQAGTESMSRQLRQISLLENVAQDIARRSHLEQSHPVSPGQRKLPFPMINGPVSSQHPHPTSCDAVLYSSGPPSNNTSLPPPRPYSVMDDPFQVRDHNRLAALGYLDSVRNHLLLGRPGTSLQNRLEHVDYFEHVPSHPPFSGSCPIPPEPIPHSPYTQTPFRLQPPVSSLSHPRPSSPSYSRRIAVSQDMNTTNGNLHLLSLLNNPGHAPSNP